MMVEYVIYPQTPSDYIVNFAPLEWSIDFRPVTICLTYYIGTQVNEL
jgi:hypothetical protein